MSARIAPVATATITARGRTYSGGGGDCSLLLTVVSVLLLSLLPQGYALRISSSNSSPVGPRRSKTYLPMAPPTTSTGSSSSSSSSSQPNGIQHVIIAGAGVIGISTAYYLARDFHITSTIIDPSGQIAPAASGKAGGFLALDWNDDPSSTIGPLTRRSFTLHQEIATSVGPSIIQYRRLKCAAIQVGNVARTTTAKTEHQRPMGQKLRGIEWAEGTNVRSNGRPLGDETTIAQVHPKLLCTTLFGEVQSMTPNSTLLKGRVVSTVYNEESSSSLSSSSIDDDGTNNVLDTTTITTTTKVLVGALLEDGSIVKGDALLYACGPWTADNILGTKYHSVIIPTIKPLSQCVFFSGLGDPEVYVRPDNTAYLTGFPDPPTKVIEQPGEEEVREDVIDKIQRSVQLASSSSSDLIFSPPIPTSSASPNDDDAAADGVGSEVVITKQACYLPSTPDGIPMMGALGTDQPNSYVSCGHTCWGILMGPASGEAMAHLMVTGKSPHVNLTAFDPTRFGTMSMVPSIP
jgi:glycine/D-amino acid oxidase-like deaminating enzyme